MYMNICSFELEKANWNTMLQMKIPMIIFVYHRFSCQTQDCLRNILYSAQTIPVAENMQTFSVLFLFQNLTIFCTLILT